MQYFKNTKKTLAELTKKKKMKNLISRQLFKYNWMYLN